MRGLPSRSVLRPAGRKLLLPALIAGEPGPRCRSPLLMNSGSASRLPPPSVPKIGLQGAPLPPAPCTMLAVNTGVLLLLETLLEPLLHRMLLRTCGLLPLVLYIPPPFGAELPLMVTFVTVTFVSVRLLVPKLYIPPPFVAELPLKVTFVSVMLVAPKLYSPPPSDPVELPSNVTWVSAGLLAKLYIPPPDV